MPQRIDEKFFTRDVLDVAPDLLGNVLVRRTENGNMSRHIITEVEVYRGEDDLACHACKGRTKRTEMMFAKGGCLYIYLIYGIHWMMNIVTGGEGNPQAVLIRGLDVFDGPGKLTKGLNIDKSFNGELLVSSQRVWVEPANQKYQVFTGPRIGIDYAGDYWAKIPWRYWINF